MRKEITWKNLKGGTTFKDWQQILKWKAVAIFSHLSLVQSDFPSTNAFLTSGLQRVWNRRNWYTSLSILRVKSPSSLSIKLSTTRLRSPNIHNFKRTFSKLTMADSAVDTTTTTEITAKVSFIHFSPTGSILRVTMANCPAIGYSLSACKRLSVMRK